MARKHSTLSDEAAPGGFLKMAISTCVKCGGTHFEIVAKEPRGANYKLMFVQCTGCGGVVGVTEFYNTGVLIQKLAKALGVKIP